MPCTLLAPPLPSRAFSAPNCSKKPVPFVVYAAKPRKKKDEIISPRHQRHLRKKDPLLDDRNQKVIWPYLETEARLFRKNGKAILVDTQTLLDLSENQYDLVVHVAQRANEYLREHPEESLTEKPIFKVVNDMMSEGAGVEPSMDAYDEDVDGVSTMEDWNCV